MNISELLARECAKQNLWHEAALALALRCEGGVVVVATQSAAKHAPRWSCGSAQIRCRQPPSW